MAGERPRVRIVATGGTIASIGPHRLDYMLYPESGKKLTISESLARIPEVEEIAEVQGEDFSSVGSTSVGPVEWIAMAQRINRIFREDTGVSGVVVTHGTATLEETSYFLHLTVKSTKPVVLTGAMRPPSALSSDADINLLDAVRVSACADASGKGVLTVLNNEVQSAREVTKANTFRVETFRPNELGFLGYVDSDGEVVFYRSPTRKHTTATPLELFQITEVEYNTRTVFIIEIAVGLGDVWQAKDKRYYKRFHYKAEPMEHYEINMVRSRGVAPDIGLVFALGDTWEQEKVAHRKLERCSIYIGVQNSTTSVVEAALFELWLCKFDNMHPRALRPFLRNGQRTVRMSGVDYNTILFHLSWPIDGSYRPIFRTVDPTYISHVSFDIDTRHVSVPDKPYSTGRSLFWRIQSPNMAAKSGKVELVMKRLPLAGGTEVSLEEEHGDFEISGEA